MSNEIVPSSRLKGAVIKTLLLAFAAASTAHAQEADRLKFEITPYLWAQTTDADVTVRGFEAEIDTDPEDTFDSAEIAGSLFTVLQFGSFVAYAQGDFIGRDSDEVDNSPQFGKIDTEKTTATVGMGIQVPGWNERSSFDIMAGARYLKFETELTVNALGTISDDQDYLDPVLIIRPSFQFSDRWRFNPTLSYSKFGDSEEVYELWPQLQFDVTENLAMRFGYRRLHYEIQSGERGNGFDGSFQGAMFGFGGKFGYRTRPMAEVAPEPETVAAVTPPPEPPPPVPPDTDRDGVADNKDLCPNTSPTDRVDAVGCGYNVKISVYFDTDSADLDSRSHAELNRVLEVLKASPTITGAIEAHTDSVGKAAYNQKLSERRAEAVANYMYEHGVPRERLESKGLGETQPVSDNRTSEGRALNRRVVLRRTDPI